MDEGQSAGRSPVLFGVQFLGLVLAVAAIGVCLALMWTIVSPEGSGEFVGLVVLMGYAFAVPLALLALAAAFFVRRGSPRLRRVGLITGGIALAMPLLVQLLYVVKR